ncbi:glycerophosphodiester phosphodiesterase [Ilumatobacter nonamiensis]|uniref:glycerophosphodiester phosphodiesterase n=1 Tax=Ilumatobacter nonamiensis TaxID=467093 RepID=UPI00034C895A|nr:glycerophosphodiester phosphodiesterase [Ilumatobacter nonamiensis]
MSSHPYLDASPPIAFAHRGGNLAAPENTMAAFEHAVSLGFRYLETDVHRTADGALVAFHDPDLNRTCGIDARIAEMTAADVAAARVHGDHRIPLMADLLEHFPEARFNIDAKSSESVAPLVDLIRAFAAVDRVCLASFQLSTLRRMRSMLGPDLVTNLAPSEVATLRILGRLPGTAVRTAQVPPAAGRIPVVTDRFVRAAHARDIAVHVWTINERAEMERLLDLGVDGIMTDDCALLKSVLEARGQWHPND